MKNTSLALVGSGPFEKKLRMRAAELGIRDKVFFFGHVPNNKLSAYYNACDVFVLPSLYEPLGIVLLEAMACGKPVVASRVGGIPELVDEKVGMLVEPKNPDALAKSILMLLSDADLAKKLGDAGRRRAEHFDWQHVLKKTLKVYEDALAMVS